MTSRSSVSALLGPDWSETRFTLGQVARIDDRGLTEVEFQSSFGDRVTGLCLPSRTGATVLYCHAHGGRYGIGKTELISGRPALLGPYLPLFVERGWGVLCLDMPCFGARTQMDENATAKARLWHGRTLFGQMLGEQRAGFDWLTTQPDVTPDKIAVMGISMGGTLAWWLAALGLPVRAAVSMCCFADMARLIETGVHDGHGNYMTVPRLLTLGSTGDVCGLAAPTPLLHCVGFGDWSTPKAAYLRAKSDLEAAYARQGAEANLQFHEAEEPGHEETPAMREAVLRFLDDHLGGR